MELKTFITINNYPNSFVIEIVYEVLEFRKEIYITYKDDLFDYVSRCNNSYKDFVELGISKTRLMKLLDSNIEKEFMKQELISIKKC